MPDLKISAMTAASTLNGTEIVPLVQTGTNVQTTTANFVAQVLNVNPATISQGGTGQTTRANALNALLPTQGANKFLHTDGAGTVTFETIDLNTDDITGTLPVANGGSGAVTLTGYLIGNGTSAFTASPTIPFSNITGTVGASQGGTGFTSYTLGDTLYGNGSNTLSKLPGNTTATTKFLQQTGTGSTSAAPQWAVISPSSINTQYGAFHYDYTTSLTSTINGTATTIPVVSTTGFSATGAIIIENEIISYTGITSTSFTGCTRGVNGSQQASHTSGTAVGGAQIVSAALTPTTIQINTVDFSNGVSVNTSTGEISVAIDGTYNIQYSAQVFNSSNAQDLINIWFDLNGSPIASSATWATTPARPSAGIPASSVVTVNIFYTLSTSDKVRLRWLSTNGNSSIVTYPAGTGYPSAPAIIVTVNQVS